MHSLSCGLNCLIFCLRLLILARDSSVCRFILDSPYPPPPAIQRIFLFHLSSSIKLYCRFSFLNSCLSIFKWQCCLYVCLLFTLSSNRQRRKPSISTFVVCKISFCSFWSFTTFLLWFYIRSLQMNITCLTILPRQFKWESVVVGGG
jgi:hypothetical protein